MDLRKLQRLVIDAIEDIKGQDVQVFNTTGLTDLFDRVILVSGTSNRQTRGIASHLRDQVKAAGADVLSVEGEDNGEWVLVDLGDIVVHIMQPAIRSYYNLEELWGGKTVHVKLAAPTLPARAAERRAAAPRAPSRA
jgi:ribosome-associated protein